jgi:hypothetical protein
MQKGLAKRKPSDVVAKRMAFAEDLKNKIFDRALETVSGALKAPELPRDIQRDEAGEYIIPEGWTQREFKAAVDALLPKKDAPFYLDLAQRNLEVQAKIDASKGIAPRGLNIGTVNIVQPPQYDVIDVTPTKE